MSTVRTTDHTTKTESRPTANGQPVIAAGELSRVCPTGICSTCEHQGTCLFLKAAHKPVWFCDEFTDVSSGDQARKPAPVVDLQPAAAVNYGEAQGIGICANCETRTDCMHRRPGEPVWECEDYR